MLRFACSIAVWLTVAAPCFAQEAVPQISLLPARLCGPLATDAPRTDAAASTKEIESLLADLPRGRERDIALELLNEVAVRRLPGFCKDPRNGDFVALLGGGTGNGAVEFRVALGNQGLPDIEVDVAARPDTGSFDYAYRVSNRAEATAPIRTWGLMTPVADRTKTLTHPIWQVGSAPPSDQVVPVTAPKGTRSGMGPLLSPGGSELSPWRADTDRFAIQAGSSLSLFAVSSAFRPGWTTAYVGSDDAIELPQQPLPEDIEAGLEVLARPEHYYTSVLTVGPKFSPGTDRPWIAGDWHFGVQGMIAAGQLSAGSPYVAELLGALARIGESASEAQVAFKVRSAPEGTMEAFVDKVVRMALRIEK